MKNVLGIGSFLVLFILLAACGNSEEVKNPPQNMTEEGQQQAGDNDTNTSASYGFTSFDLDADYTDLNDALDIEYENESNDTMEASYQDRSQDIDLKGDAAMEELDRIFASFNFDENTPEQEVISSIIEAFQIPDNAQIELDIDFNSGTEKEYRK